MSGVDLKFRMYGGSESRQRFGSSPSRSSKMCLELAHHSPPPGMVMLRKPSTDFQRQAILNFEKFSAEIRSRGEYLVLATSPP